MNLSINLKGLTFLVADSDQFFQGLLRSILRSFGAESIIVTGSGEKALTLAESGVDFVICDAYLDDIDGFDLCKRFRGHKKRDLKYVPVIVLTSHTQVGTVLKARDSGASLVLAKPISPTTVFSRLIWLANDRRAFIQCKGFLGPDRRFQVLPPPRTGDRRLATED